MTEADVVLIGGHGIEDSELKYGLSVTGFIHPSRVLTKKTIRPGDMLILTKPLGTDEGINPHLFTIPKLTARLAMNIAAGLSKVDPDGAAIYAKNAQQYVDKLNALADDFTALGKTVKNNRIITQHGVFDYLARDMGLEVCAVVQAHAGQEPSAAEMLEIIHTAKEKKVAAVFTEPQYPARVEQTIAREAGILTARLDPAATGPEDGDEPVACGCGGMPTTINGWLDRQDEICFPPCG